MIDTGDFWLLTALLAVGTFLIRFSFLGIFGGRSLPHWAQMHLKYVGVAVFPALVAPLVMWPEATGGAVDPVRLVAAVAAFFDRAALWGDLVNPCRHGHTLCAAISAA